MNRNRHSSRQLLARAVLIAVISMVGGNISIAFAQMAQYSTPQQQSIPTPQSQPAQTETVRPEIALVVMGAQELMSTQKFQEALAKVREGDRVADRTGFEDFVLDQIRGLAAARAGDLPTATKSYEAVVASGRLVRTDQLKVVEVLAQLYFEAKDYPKAATWSARYVTEGGTDPQTRLLRVRSLYLAEDFAGAAVELRASVAADEKAGIAPPLSRLQLLASCYVKLKDDAGYVSTLEKLLAYYPNKDYWADAIRRVETRAGFADRLRLDALRLRHATGALNGAAQYAAMMQLALNAGFPAEAKRIADLGFSSGLLGTGADVDLQKRLRDMATKQAAEDENLLTQNAASAGAAKDGTALVNVGYAFVSSGQFDKGLALMEQGMQKGGIARLDDAKLHLAIAYLAGGQKAKATAMFKGVQGSDGAADLAHLWLIQAQRS